MDTLTATAVRIGAQVFLIPHEQPIPDDAIVYGKATAEAVYATFYEATHCRRGHPRVEGPKRCIAEQLAHCDAYEARFEAWTWGAPA